MAARVAAHALDQPIQLVFMSSSTLVSRLRVAVCRSGHLFRTHDPLGRLWSLPREGALDGDPRRA